MHRCTAVLNLSGLGRGFLLYPVFAPPAHAKALVDKLQCDVVRGRCPRTRSEGRAAPSDIDCQAVSIRLASMAAYFDEELAKHCHGILSGLPGALCHQT